MKRIFIALEVKAGDALLRMLSTFKSLLGNEKIKWVEPGNIHLTLAFLGDTEDDRIKVAAIMLKNACTGFGEFNFTLTGTGVFKNYNDPKVIWIGIEESEKLVKLNDIINTGLKDTGFKVEDRQFRPHLTLGRIKYLKNVDALKTALGRYQKSLIQKVHVEEVILYESILKPTGPIYKSVGKFRLN